MLGLFKKNSKENIIIEKLLKFSAIKVDHFDTGALDTYRKTLSDKIKHAERNGGELTFVLPGFPYKSANHKTKTLSHLPDYAERAALRRLHTLMNDLSRTTGHKCRLVICSDGFAFNDLKGIPDRNVLAYRHCLENDLKAYKNISIMDMNDVLRKVKSNNIKGLNLDSTSKMKRDFLMTHYGRGTDHLRRDIIDKDNLTTLYNCLSIFAKHDLVRKPEESKKAFNRRCKDVALNVMARSEAWAGLVKDAFPNAVRLSIHPYKDCSEKMPIKLLPALDGRWRTPWHNTAVICDSPWPLHSTVKLASLKWTKAHDAVFMGEYLDDPMARVFMEKNLYTNTEVMKYAAF